MKTRTTACLAMVFLLFLCSQMPPLLRAAQQQREQRSREASLRLVEASTRSERFARAEEARLRSQLQLPSRDAWGSSSRVLTVVETPAPLTAEQQAKVAANEQAALARLQRFNVGESLFRPDESPVVEQTQLGPELVYGGYRYTGVVVDENGRRTQVDPTSLGAHAQYRLFAWADTRETGKTAFVLGSEGDVVANADTNACGKSGMTAGCKCGDRFTGTHTVREALGADRAHGGEWKLACASPSIQ